jgi:hypothetical protein
MKRTKKVVGGRRFICDFRRKISKRQLHCNSNEDVTFTFWEAKLQEIYIINYDIQIYQLVGDGNPILEIKDLCFTKIIIRMSFDFGCLNSVL